MLTSMVVGFTGSQHGMTGRQKDSLAQLFRWLPIQALRHGDCIGADKEANDIYEDISFLPVILLHPCDIESKRAFCNGNLMHNPLPPLRRNRYIAGCVAGFQTDLLIAAPAQVHEIVRSGTWATVRHARKMGTPRIILLP